MYLAQAAISGIGIAPFEALIEISVSHNQTTKSRSYQLARYLIFILPTREAPSLVSILPRSQVVHSLDPWLGGTLMHPWDGIGSLNLA